MLTGLWLTTLYPAWVLGGSRAPTQWTVLVLATLSLILSLSCMRRSGASWGKRLLGDPVLWTGGAFLLLLLIQWLNGGRDLLYDYATQRWSYAPPPIAWLPGAVTRPDGLEALRWFIPPWMVMLILRHAVSREMLSRFYRGMVAGAAGLAFLALIQWSLAQAGIPGVPSPDDFYFATSFGYMNHAGAYCILLFSLALGLLLKTFRTRFNSPAITRTRLVWGAACLVLFAGAHASACRAAICLAWFLACTALLLFLFQGWTTRTPVQRLNRGLAIAAIACLLLFLVDGFGHTMLKREFVVRLAQHTSAKIDSPMTLVSAIIREGAGGDRNLFREIAFRIWKEHPWLGAGLWAQRYFMGTYLPPSEWSLVLDDGAANVHTDALQFLSEFGVAGFILMGITVLVLLWHMLRKIRGLLVVPDRLIVALGLAIILVYSGVDLPFRSPAILLAWTAMLAGESTYWKARKPSV